MRSKLYEQSTKLHRARPHRELVGTRLPLEPLAVDAAMEDDTLPVLTERGSRRDPAGLAIRSEKPMRPQRASMAGSNDADLLETLAEQLNLLGEQQRQIRQLLDQAGHTRIDRANT
jgi:hypothetical protein